MKKVSHFLSVFFTVLIFANFIFAEDVYESMATLPASSSNYINEQILEGFDDRDYDLYEVCSARALELELESSLATFLKVYKTSDPSGNAYDPMEEANYLPYFYIAALAIGQLGGEDEAVLLSTTLVRSTDSYVGYYVLTALGDLTDSETALETLNNACSWVDSVMLAKALLGAMEKHASFSSLAPLNELYSNPGLASIRDDIIEVTTYISENGS